MSEVLDDASCVRLAKRYATWLPYHTAIDWEDLYQEMQIRQFQHPSIIACHWAAKNAIRQERVQARPKEVGDWVLQQRVSLDVICEAYRFLGRWPWLVGLMLEGGKEQLARQMGMHPSAIYRRINRIRAELGLMRGRYDRAKGVEGE